MAFPYDSKAGDIVYKAQSQDEDALVIAAAKLHMVFVNKNANILGNSHLISVLLSMEYVPTKVVLICSLLFTEHRNQV